MGRITAFINYNFVSHENSFIFSNNKLWNYGIGIFILNNSCIILFFIYNPRIHINCIAIIFIITEITILQVNCSCMKYFIIVYVVDSMSSERITMVTAHIAFSMYEHDQ